MAIQWGGAWPSGSGLSPAQLPGRQQTEVSACPAGPHQRPGPPSAAAWLLLPALSGFLVAGGQMPGRGPQALREIRFWDSPGIIVLREMSQQ